MYSKIKIGLVLMIVFSGACSSALYIPTQTDADKAGVSTESLIQGRNLYVSKCGSCHNLHLPEQYTQEKWKEEMPEMQRKAKISGEEAKLITSFLLARCKPE
ncbi:MAG TPA: hypothetical protein PLG33_02270 [Prolixibacteraceae bacterium]|nr:hypothetical protein [Prolixibacteraceae bacterium]